MNKVYWIGDRAAEMAEAVGGESVNADIDVFGIAARLREAVNDCNDGRVWDIAHELLPPAPGGNTRSHAPSRRPPS